VNPDLGSCQLCQFVMNEWFGILSSTPICHESWFRILPTTPICHGWSDALHSQERNSNMFYWGRIIIWQSSINWWNLTKF